MRVFLDTNVLVSAFATRGSCADVLAVVLAGHRLIAGELVLRELQRVLAGKIGLPGDISGEVVSFLRREATVVAVATDNLEIEVRDPDDIEVLAEAIAGRAGVLVTGDRDLPEHAVHPGITILFARGFWERLAQAAACRRARTDRPTVPGFPSSGSVRPCRHRLRGDHGRRREDWSGRSQTETARSRRASGRPPDEPSPGPGVVRRPLNRPVPLGQDRCSPEATDRTPGRRG